MLFVNSCVKFAFDFQNSALHPTHSLTLLCVFAWPIFPFCFCSCRKAIQTHSSHAAVASLPLANTLFNHLMGIVSKYHENWRNQFNCKKCLLLHVHRYASFNMNNKLNWMNQGEIFQLIILISVPPEYILVYSVCLFICSAPFFHFFNCKCTCLIIFAVIHAATALHATLVWN